eukprot:713162-Rhodomonas_salina.1
MALRGWLVEQKGRLSLRIGCIPRRSHSTTMMSQIKQLAGITVGFFILAGRRCGLADEKQKGDSPKLLRSFRAAAKS